MGEVASDKILKIAVPEYYNPASIIEDLPDVKDIQEMMVIYRTSEGLKHMTSKMSLANMVFMLRQIEHTLFE